MARLNKLLFFLISLSIPGFLFAQIAFEDAFKLQRTVIADQVIINDNPGNHEILAKYMGKSDPSATDIKQEFLDNPFFKIAGGVMAFEKFSNLSTGLSSIGNLDITNLADGFAKFLVKRTKEELNVAFFSRFYELISREEYKDARILFPQTYITLSAIGDQIYNYQAYINTLRESFEKDLNGLLDNLPKVINDGRYRVFFNKHPDLKAACLGALYIGKELIDKQHPGKIIADYDVSLLDAVNPDVKAVIQTLQLFSKSLRSAEPGRPYWITGDQVKLLIEDPLTLQIYFGLIYQQAKTGKIKFSNGELTTLLKENLLPAATKLNSYNSFIQGFIREGSAVTESIKNISGKDRDKITFTDYYDFYNNSLNVIEYVKQVAELPGIKGKIVISDKADDYMKIARAGGYIALDISRKNYGSAIINTYVVYDFSFGGNDNDLQKIIDGHGADASAASSLLKDRSAELQNKITNTEYVKKFLLKYGAFISAIVQAENSDEVAMAIEAAALPSGSSRIKRETGFNVSLNAYTGLFTGHESIKGIKDNRVFNTYGIAAPVGVAVSTGRNHWSYSAFVSVIDLGAVAAFRFKDDTTAQVPTIQLKNIFSPGLFLSIGFPKMPLSLNVGAQMGPNLRKIDHNNSTQPSMDNNNNIYWRYSVSLCVDIPLLNFYTRSD